jgi:hypothetical protein
MQPLDFHPHLGAQLGVKVGQRFVEQEHLRMPHNRAPHRHPLPLPARQLPRLAVQKRGQRQDLGGLGHRLFDLGLGPLGDMQGKAQIFAHRHMRIKRVVLEHHRDIAIPRRQVVDHRITDPHLAARDILQPRDHPQRGGFAAARRPHQHHKFAVGNVQIDGVDHIHRAVTLDHIA